MQDQPRAVRYFYMRPVEIKYRSKQAGRPIFEDRLYWVDKCPGDRNMSIDRPISNSELDEILNLEPRPDEDMARAGERQMMRELYLRFQKGLEQMPEGMPLEKWPQITASQVKTLKYSEIHTVEQLKSIPDGTLQSLGTGYLQLKQQARDYLEDASKTEVLNEAKAEIDALRKEIEEMKNTRKKPGPKKKVA